MAEAPKRISLARSLRKKAVPAEARLWKALRNRALAGFKFRRQHPVGPYVVDFACVECKLVVEVDGATHLTTRRRDGRRTAVLEAEGWLVMRFWNTEVYDDLDPVKEAIYRQCVTRGAPGLPPHPSPLPPPFTPPKGH
jgi:very-short-patch-repair endonuclease